MSDTPITDQQERDASQFQDGPVRSVRYLLLCRAFERENAKLREALQAIADEAVKHHEHNPISGKDRLPLGYISILNIAHEVLHPDAPHIDQSANDALRS